MVLKIENTYPWDGHASQTNQSLIFFGTWSRHPSSRIAWQQAKRESERRQPFTKPQSNGATIPPGLPVKDEKEDCWKDLQGPLKQNFNKLMFHDQITGTMQWLHGCVGRFQELRRDFGYRELFHSTQISISAEPQQ